MKIFRDIIAPLLFAVVAAVVSVVWLQSLCRVESAVEAVPESELLSEEECEISIYDNVFRRVGRTCGIDWRLMSAIAYSESRFCGDAVSPRGAVGLMQIMPHVAHEYGMTDEDLFDPVLNIELAAKIIKSVEKMMHLPRKVPLRDRTALMLACYNGGYAHITDARNLAAYYGEDCHSWEVVAEYLELLAESDFYEHEAVSYGEFTGSGETIKYVDTVMSRYDKYCRAFSPDDGA